MSASPIARQATQSQNIPATKNVIIENENQLPANYSSTPGGTLFSTTPGGTRIVYERAFLMNLRNSPISRTPPKGMPSMPNNILKGTTNNANNANNAVKTLSPPIKETPDESAEQFEMDM